MTKFFFVSGVTLVIASQGFAMGRKPPAPVSQSTGPDPAVIVTGATNDAVYGAHQVADPAPDRTMDQRLAEITESCVNRDWSQVKCDENPLPASETEQYKPGSSIFDAGWLASGSKSPTAQSNLNQLMALVDQVPAHQKLTPCQTACLVTCATSHFGYYDYEQDVNDVSGGKDSRFLETGKGICYEFATVAVEIARHLGLDAQSTGAAEHSFLQVKLGGQNKYMEPQSDSCRLF